MQDGREPKTDDVDIERHESSESIRKPVDPEQQLDEVARRPGQQADGDDEQASPEDPEEAQSPT